MPPVVSKNACMTVPNTQSQIVVARDAVWDRLLSARNLQGHWPGELCSSALSTATAVVALELAKRAEPASDQAGIWARLIDHGADWLLSHQRSDGGWGDTDRSYANIATTMLAQAALTLTRSDDQNAQEAIAAAGVYLQENGMWDGLRRRYGVDQTFAVPIMTCCAICGLVEWDEVPALPFELASLPQSWYRFLRIPVVSYAIPALVAIGQAKFFHRPPGNPLMRWIRRLTTGRTLRVLRRVQPVSGGFLEAIPLTSFVVMSLESIGRHSHPVAQKGLQFLVESARDDGSWPIDTNLATWNTTLAVQHLAVGGFDVSRLNCLEWILDCQVRTRHPYTGAAAGGWGWSDLSGSVPDADDTPSALLALRWFHQHPSTSNEQRARIETAATDGLNWLRHLQNSNGGWPTFCRGWGKLPFDRSGADLTAHAIRAISAWRDLVNPRQWQRPIQKGLRYLEGTQRDDGSWLPLWFGNQDHIEETNPVYGTVKVLAAFRDLKMTDTAAARRGFDFLTRAQNEDGGWGGGPAVAEYATELGTSSVEETSLAVELLASLGDHDQEPLERGAGWLIRAVQANSICEPSPIGFYFARLWYYEALYPISFAAAALGRAAGGGLETDEFQPERTD